MAKTQRFKRGQLVQDITDVIYIYIKRNRLTSHVVKLDQTGAPIEICEVETKLLTKLKQVPEGFTSIQIL
jgi:hypothetical protein